MGVSVPRRPTYIHPERKTQKVEALLSRIHHSGLLLVQPQSQSMKYPPDHLHRLLGAFPAQYDEIIGVSNQAGFKPPLKMLSIPPPVQQVQIQVGQQRRDDAPLRGAHAVGLAAADALPRTVSILPHDRRLEPHPKNVQNGTVHNALGHHGHQLGVRNAVEVLGNIRIDDIGLPAIKGIGDVINGIVS